MPVSFLPAVMWTFLSVTTYSTHAIGLHNGILHQDAVFHDTHPCLTLAAAEQHAVLDGALDDAAVSRCRVFLTELPCDIAGRGYRRGPWCRQEPVGEQGVHAAHPCKQTHVLVKVALDVRDTGGSSPCTRKPGRCSSFRLRARMSALEVDKTVGTAASWIRWIRLSRSMTYDVHGEVLLTHTVVVGQDLLSHGRSRRCGWYSCRCGHASGIGGAVVDHGDVGAALQRGRRSSCRSRGSWQRRSQTE